jgi:hypothetical protein
MSIMKLWSEREVLLLYFQGGERSLNFGFEGTGACVVLDEELLDIVQIFENDDSGIAVQMLLRYSGMVMLFSIYICHCYR